MSLVVSPARPYPLPSTLLLNVLGQIAAFLGDNKKNSERKLKLGITLLHSTKIKSGSRDIATPIQNLGAKRGVVYSIPLPL
jgi:hypothetical protein